jgi:hypothetical protein
MDRGRHIDFSRLKPKITILEYVMPRLLIMRYRSFGGTYCLHIQGSPRPFWYTVMVRRQGPPKRRKQITNPKGVIYQETVIVINIVVKYPNHKRNETDFVRQSSNKSAANW